MMFVAGVRFIITFMINNNVLQFVLQSETIFKLSLMLPDT